MNDQAETVNILSAIANLQSAQEYQELNWEGSLEDYLKLVQESPRVTRNAFQRIYDMIISHGVEEYVEHKKKITRYRFSRIMPTTGGTRFTGSTRALRTWSISSSRPPGTTVRSVASSCCTARSAARRARWSAC